MNLMESLQFVMTDMVTELDKAGAGKGENSTKSTETYIVPEDDGSSLPKFPSKKVSLEHICQAFVCIHKYCWPTRASATASL
jgi:hypothetical protein